MQKVYIVEAGRTPIGTYLGALSSLTTVELGIIAAKATIERSSIKPEQIENVVAGVVYRAGTRGNPARQIQIACGIPFETSASTVDQQCASSMRALEMAAMEIALEKNDIALVVGAESMSNTPNLIMNAKTGSRMGPLHVEDALLYDALNCALAGGHMGTTAENLAEMYKISREEQDELAYESHRRAIAAQAAGRFDKEMIPVEITTKKGTVIVNKDGGPRADVSLESLAKLKPAFRKGGTVTAGNASSVNDGAACVILVSERKLKELGLKPIAEIISIEAYGVDPKIMGIGPAYAVPKALKSAGLSKEDIGIWELNEAFAAQFLACNRELKLDPAIVNRLGSGISLGHPVGMTGVRIVVTALSQLDWINAEFLVASLCVGGGPAMATVLKSMR